MALAIPSTRNVARQRTFSGVPSTTWGDTLTASGTPHSLGTITQIIAATTYESEWIRITCQETFTSATDTNGLLNIYIGPATETLLIASLPAGWSGTTVGGMMPRSYWFPIRIPRGTRISGAYRALIASDTVEVLIELGVSNGMHWVGSGVEVLGADIANSRGTAVTPGSAAEGSYATIGTTGRRYRYIVPGIMGNNDTTMLARLVGWDVGVGSAAYQGLNDFLHIMDTNEVNTQAEDGFWCDIPSGTALQLRAAADGAVSGLVYATLHGVY